jgi:hypothetical protein
MSERRYLRGVVSGEAYSICNRRCGTDRRVDTSLSCTLGDAMYSFKEATEAPTGHVRMYIHLGGQQSCRGVKSYSSALSKQTSRYAAVDLRRFTCHDC